MMGDGYVTSADRGSVVTVAGVTGFARGVQALPRIVNKNTSSFDFRNMFPFMNQRCVDPLQQQKRFNFTRRGENRH